MDHSQAMQLRDASLLLVCIGDSLRKIGFGGGGNVALHDANELAGLFATSGVSDATTGSLTVERRGDLRALEKMPRRRIEFADRERRHTLLHLQPTADGSRDIDLAALVLQCGTRFKATWYKPLAGLVDDVD